MRRYLPAWFFVVATLLCAQLHPMHAQQMLTPIVDFGKPRGSSFVGAGDVQAFGAWYGVRAYTSATRGNKLLNVCNSTGGTDVACADMVSDATTGALVSQTIGGISCPGTICTVKIAYDQGGGHFCSSAPCNASQATIANRPNLASVGGFPAIQCTGSSQLISANTGGTAFSAPYSLNGVAERTAAFTNTGLIISANAQPFLGWIDVANTGEFGTHPGVDVNKTASDSVFHALVGTADGTTSTLYVDSSASPGTAAGAADAWGFFFSLCQEGGGGNALTGNIREAGAINAGAISSTVAGNLITNQRTYYGF